jgi:hypothetical protein
MHILCLIKLYAMETYGGAGAWSHTFLTSALDGDESFRLRLLYPRERAAGSNWIGSWMGPRVGMDVVGKRKMFARPLLGIIPVSFIR